MGDGEVHYITEDIRVPATRKLEDRSHKCLESMLLTMKSPKEDRD
jgi:hypothetical protein